MQAGIISEENLAQILRGLSQKRRHGVLEVHAGDKIVEVAFYQGKIVDVIERHQPLARRMALRLERRGLLTGGEWIQTIETRQQLLDEAASQGEEIPPALIQLAQEQQALDDLYGLGLVEGSYYHFRVEMVAPPAEDDLQLSVGQLLLDLVAIKEGHAAFKNRFPDTLVLRRKGRVEDFSGAVDRDIAGLADGECSVANLRRCSLLGRLLFEETVTHLVNTGGLTDGAEPASGRLRFDLSALDASIDQFTAETCRSMEVDQIDRDHGDSPIPAPLIERAVSAVAGEAIAAVEAVPESAAAASVGSPISMGKLNQRLLENVHTPEMVLAIFAALAVAIPLLLW